MSNDGINNFNCVYACVLHIYRQETTLIMEEFILDIKGDLVDFTDLYIVNIKEVNSGYKLSNDRVSLKEGAKDHLFNIYLYCYTLFGDNKYSLVVLTDDQDTAWRLAVTLKQEGYYYNDDFIPIR